MSAPGLRMTPGVCECDEGRGPRCPWCVVEEARVRHHAAADLDELRAQVDALIAVRFSEATHENDAEWDERREEVRCLLLRLGVLLNVRVRT